MFAITYGFGNNCSMTDEELKKKRQSDEKKNITCPRCNSQKICKVSFMFTVVRCPRFNLCTPDS